MHLNKSRGSNSPVGSSKNLFVPQELFKTTLFGYSTVIVPIISALELSSLKTSKAFCSSSFGTAKTKVPSFAKL